MAKRKASKSSTNVKVAPVPIEKKEVATKSPKNPEKQPETPQAEEVPELKEMPSTVSQKPVKGRSASGKTWKMPHKRASSKMDIPHLKTTYEQRMEQKRRLEEVRRYEHEVLGGIEKEKARIKEARLAHKKAKEANEKKSEVVVKMTNRHKLSKLTKKQMRSIRLTSL